MRLPTAFPTACSGSFLPSNLRYSSTAAWGRVTTCPRLLFFRQSSTARISMLQGDKAMCSMAVQRAARLVTLAIVLVVGCVFGWPSHEARAQRVQQGSQLDIDYYSLPPRRGDKVRVRRPPLMPPTPKDFGPHFDFPAGGSENFNCGSGSGYYCGAPSEAPYLH
jgi:hypothetical protein